MAAKLCQSLDRAEACRAIIDEHGEAVAINGVIRANPFAGEDEALLHVG